MLRKYQVTVTFESHFSIRMSAKFLIFDRLTWKSHAQKLRKTLINQEANVSGKQTKNHNPNGRQEQTCYILGSSPDRFCSEGSVTSSGYYAYAIAEGQSTGNTKRCAKGLVATGGKFMVRHESSTEAGKIIIYLHYSCIVCALTFRSVQLRSQV